ncbi:MAG: DUF86 domain-containing protein [Ghiorsea sp.]|nr:DUF86 domain-containing protein [Ghiorsea sp.]
MDNILINKAAMIERCLKRIEEEYIGHEAELESNFTRQDSIILNLQRACEAAIDAAMHVVRTHKLGIPQQSRDAFAMMQEATLLDDELSRHMQAMVGFRNVAVHDYRRLNMAILRAILNGHLDDFRGFSRCLIALADEEDV